MIKMPKYYCIRCKKCHYRGKIFKEHLDYKRDKKSKNKNSDYNNIKINFDKLRPVTKRQFRRLYIKMKASKNRELYKNEIIKLIKNENRKSL